MGYLMRQSSKNIALSVLIALICIKVAFSVTASPTWVGTTYIQSGFKIIVLNGAPQSGTNVYTYTYSPAFSATPYTALGLINLQSMTLLEQILRFLINIQNFSSTTSLQIRMNMPTSSWRQFRASYIAVDAQFSQVLVDYFSATNMPNVGTGKGSRSYIGVFNLNIAAVNISHRISIIPLLIGAYSQSVNGEHIFFWDTKLRSATSINYNITVDRTTRLYNIVSYILVVDRTSAENGLEIFMDELYLGGTNNSPVYNTPVYYNLTNMHAGLNSVSFSLPAFNFDKSSFLLSSLGYYKFLNISVWSYRERQCPVGQAYYELSANLCYDTCLPGFVNSNGATKKYCKACGDFIAACLTCSSDGSSCNTCAGNYVVSGGACVCPNGYYVSSTSTNYTDKCALCHTTCLTCNGPASTNCLSCSASRTQNGSSCQCTYETAPNGACYLSNCNDQPCISCPSNPSLCHNCTTGFIISGARCVCGINTYYDVSTVSCLSCHTSCQYCSGPGSTDCTSCDRTTNHRYLSSNQCLCIQGYTQVNLTCQSNNAGSCSEPGYAIDSTTGQCLQICGKGNRITLECDDGNTNDGDGCSSTCTIQPGFTCVQNVLAPNRRSFCSYTDPISLTLLSTYKDIHKNTVYMNFTLDPTLSYILDNYPDLTDQISFNNSIATVESAFYNSTTRTVQLAATYSDSIQFVPLGLNFKMPENALTYAIPQSSLPIQIKPENKLLAVYSQGATSTNLNIFTIISKVCYIGGLVTFVLLMFTRKMIGLDYIVMLQLCYFGIMLSSYGHAYLGPIQQWLYINGYNSINMQISVAKLVDNSFWILGYQDYFAVNVNVMLFVCVANYVVALLLYIFSMLSDRSTSRKLKTSAIFFAVDIGFALLMFSVNNIAVSMFLQAMAGHMFKFTYGLNKFLVVVALLMFLGQVGAYFYKIHDLTDSQMFYHRNKNYCHFYPFIFLLRNLLVIIFIVLSTLIPKFSAPIVLGIQGAYIVSIAAGRPYKRYIDYARMASVEAPLVLLLICQLIQANFITDFSSVSVAQQQFIDYAAIAIYAAMLLGLLMSWVSFAWHLWKNKSVDASIVPEPEVEDDDLFIHNPDLSNSHTKLKEPSIREQQKSKQLLVFDVEDEQNTGAVNSQYLSQSVYNQTSRRKLKTRKSESSKKQSRQYS